VLCRCSGRNFCSKFLTQLFEHFCACRGLHSANHCDQGTLERCFLLQKLSIDDANFCQKGWRQKWEKGRCSSLPVTGGTAVNVLKKRTLSFNTELKSRSLLLLLFRLGSSAFTGTQTPSYVHYFFFFCPTERPTFTRGRAMRNETFYGDGRILELY